MPANTATAQPYSNFCLHCCPTLPSPTNPPANPPVHPFALHSINNHSHAPPIYWHNPLITILINYPSLAHSQFPASPSLELWHICAKISLNPSNPKPHPPIACYAHRRPDIPASRPTLSATYTSTHISPHILQFPRLFVPLYINRTCLWTSY